jgi:tetratricopeptide (TPR) repeat protein
MGYFMLGYYHFIKGQDKQANAEFKKGFALNANHAFGVGLYAITLMYQTRYDEALDYFARMGRLSPIGNPGNLHFLGETYRLLGRHDEAIEVFTEILGMAPRYMGVRVKLICAYVAAGRLEEARSEMKIFRHNHPAFTVTQFRNDWAPRMSSYRDPDEIGRMAQLLRTAGLPE